MADALTLGSSPLDSSELQTRAGTRVLHLGVTLFVEVKGFMPVPLEATIISCHVGAQLLIASEVGVTAQRQLLLYMCLHRGQAHSSTEPRITLPATLADQAREQHLRR